MLKLKRSNTDSDDSSDDDVTEHLTKNEYKSLLRKRKSSPMNAKKRINNISSDDRPHKDALDPFDRRTHETTPIEIQERHTARTLSTISIYLDHHSKRQDLETRKGTRMCQKMFDSMYKMLALIAKIDYSYPALSKSFNKTTGKKIISTFGSKAITGSGPSSKFSPTAVLTVLWVAELVQHGAKELEFMFELSKIRGPNNDYQYYLHCVQFRKWILDKYKTLAVLNKDWHSKNRA